MAASSTAAPVPAPPAACRAGPEEASPCRGHEGVAAGRDLLECASLQERRCTECEAQGSPEDETRRCHLSGFRTDGTCEVEDPDALCSEHRARSCLPGEACPASPTRRGRAWRCMRGPLWRVLPVCLAWVCALAVAQGQVLAGPRGQGRLFGAQWETDVRIILDDAAPVRWGEPGTTRGTTAWPRILHGSGQSGKSRAAPGGGQAGAANSSAASVSPRGSSPSPHPGGTGGAAPGAQEQQQRESELAVRWCCVGSAELAFCEGLVPALSQADRGLDFSCVARRSKEECMDAIGAGKAELVNLDAGLAYRAFIGKRMKAIMAERLDYGESYDAVAVVRKEFCFEKRTGATADTSPPQAAAQGTDTPPASTSTDVPPGPERGRDALWLQMPQLRACHPFYGSSAGWDLPALLIQALHLPSSARGTEAGRLSPDAQLLASVFAKTCAPGTTAPASGSVPGPEGGGQGTLQQRLCGGCMSVDGKGSCDLHDPYAGFAGAFRCLMETAGDVAFTRSAVPLLFARGGHLAQHWSTQAASEFRFLCPPAVGGCVSIVDNPAALNCTLGQVPANVIMTRNAISESDKLRIVERLEQAGTVPAWRRVLYEAGRNPRDYLLTSSARGLVRVDDLTRAYLGPAGVAAARIETFNFDGDGHLGGKSNAGNRMGSKGALWALLFLSALAQMAVLYCLSIHCI